MDTTPRIATSDRLTTLNDTAVRAGFNDVISDVVIGRLDPDGYHILTPMIEHHTGGHAHQPWVLRHVRCLVLVKLRGRDRPLAGMLDVATGPLMALPTV